jgi:hypothetical protein
MPATHPGAEGVPADGIEPEATLAGWRERGLHRLDPARFHVLESLARRAAQQPEAVRTLLLQRLAVLMHAYAQPAEAADGTAPGRGSEPRGASPLAELARSLPRRGAEGPSARVPGEADSVDYFRTTWSRLKLQRQLSRSFDRRPKNAGPLNSHRLVLEALQTMQGASPGYLGRFMAYVDALFWLEHAGAGPAAAAPDAGAPEPTRRSAGGRRRKKSQGDGRAAS